MTFFTSSPEGAETCTGGIVNMWKTEDRAKVGLRRKLRILQDLRVTSVLHDRLIVDKFTSESPENFVMYPVSRALVARL